MSERKAISIYDLGSGAIGILEKELADLRARLLEWKDAYDTLVGRFELHMDILDCHQALTDYAGIYYDVLVGDLVGEAADLRAALDVAMGERDQWRERAQRMQADAAALRIALKWYGDLVYSHQMRLPPDVQFVAETVLEATNAGDALLIELEAARKVVAAVRTTVGTDPAYKDLARLTFALRAALSAYDAARDGGNP